MQFVKYIDLFEKDRNEFDVLIIYIPKQLGRDREGGEKGYCVFFVSLLNKYCAGKGNCHSDN